MYDFIPRGNGNWPGCHGSEDPASAHARQARCITAHSQRTDKVNQRAVFRVFETSPARKQRDIRPEHLAGCHVVVRHDGRLALNTHGGLAEPLLGGCREAMAACQLPRVPVGRRRTASCSRTTASISTSPVGRCTASPLPLRRGTQPRLTMTWTLSHADSHTRAR